MTMSDPEIFMARRYSCRGLLGPFLNPSCPSMQSTVQVVTVYVCRRDRTPIFPRLPIHLAPQVNIWWYERELEGQKGSQNWAEGRGLSL